MTNGTLSRFIKKLFKRKFDNKESFDNALKQQRRKHKEPQKISSRDLYIGFDLGTSCSKVIVRDNIDGTVIPVKFTEYGYTSNPFLLPSRIYLRQDLLSIKKLTPSDIEIKDIKSNFINNIKINDNIPSPDVVLISYFAITFKHIRKHVVESRKIYSNTKLNWHVNVGIPCLNIQNDDLVDRYKKAIVDAWGISISPVFSSEDESININLVKEYIEKTKCVSDEQSNLNKEYFNVFPELFASIKSQIDQRRLEINKMYFMVDIGASTVDMATFNLFRDEEMDLNYAIFVPTIKQIGSYRFGLDLIKNLNNDNYELEEIKNILFSLAEGDKEYDLYKVFGGDIIRNEIYDKYKREYMTQIGETIINTKRDYHQEAHEWQEGLPTFIVGGGQEFTINDKFYLLYLNNKFHEMNNFGISSPNIKESYSPSYFNTEELLISNYHRFLVADGLADDNYNLGKVLKKVKKQKQQKSQCVDIEEIFVSKDMV